MKPFEQHLCLFAAVGFDDADHDVRLLAVLGLGRREHFAGRANGGRGAQEDLDAAVPYLLGCVKEYLRRWSRVSVVVQRPPNGSPSSLKRVKAQRLHPPKRTPGSH